MLNGVRTMTAMHYFARFSTWRKIVVIRAVFCASIQRFLHVFLAFTRLFYTKMLYLESLRVAKLDFAMEIVTLRACQVNVSHFSNKVKFSHFCLCIVVGRNF